MNDPTILTSTRSGKSYRVGSAFRQGAQQLFEAYDPDGQRCWIKHVPTDDEAAIARLRYEAIIMGKLDHPRISRLLDRGRTRECFFLVTSPIQGRSLRAVVASGPQPAEQVLGIAVHLAELLVYLHSQGIICRALPPDALYVDHLGRAVLADLSRAWDEVSPPRAGGPIDDATYLSPEEAGGAPAERRSDMYACGVLLFELLAGRPPFQSGNRGDLALQHLLTPPPDLRMLHPDTPPDLASVVERCLAKAATQRYASANALLETLRQLAHAKPHVETANEPATPIHWFMRRVGARAQQLAEESHD